MRHAHDKSAHDIHFTDTMKLQVKKDVFLSNNTNKQRFINMLGRKFEDIGIMVKHANGDADTLIVCTHCLVHEDSRTHYSSRGRGYRSLSVVPL